MAWHYALRRDRRRRPIRYAQRTLHAVERNAMPRQAIVPGDAGSRLLLRMGGKPSSEGAQQPDPRVPHHRNTYEFRLGRPMLELNNHSRCHRSTRLWATAILS